jgi:glycosyltransferase involved in cell wall biosynthesis
MPERKIVGDPKASRHGRTQRQPAVRCNSLTYGPPTPCKGNSNLKDVSFQTDVIANDGVNTAEGEGWGLVAFEHACAGAAQVLPDHGACTELWSESGILFPAPRLAPNLPPTPDPDGLAAALDRLYADRRFLAERSEACCAWARSPQFDWKAIAGQWRRLFTDVLGG